MKPRLEREAEQMLARNLANWGSGRKPAAGKKPLTDFQLQALRSYVRMMEDRQDDRV